MSKDTILLGLLLLVLMSFNPAILVLGVLILMMSDSPGKATPKKAAAEKKG